MADENQTKGERARQAILDTAYSHFIHQGYAATSMRQIAKTAHMAPGSIYNYYASKEEMFKAILDERHPFLQILPILNSVKGDSVEDFSRNAAHTLVDQIGHHPEFLNLMLIEIVEFEGAHVPACSRNSCPRSFRLPGA